MQEIRHFLLDSPASVALDVAGRGEILVVQGTVWATIEGAPRDHWLAAGDTLPVMQGQRVWLSAESGDAGLQFRLSACQTRRSYGKKPLDVARRWQRDALLAR
ncbi:DUF2917 domain-containing protein [Chitinasiproducens palmae]|uniref:DUF2917 domain-containing protein n=1 Tax=Chitinasiproducens palmae TaxID=1770053 RepID=A0A1H2PUP9_9BURK|nr:DUF2917 domain-containing protein [Chitinasiproducens palmae]SDV50933.1 Protein of unknown function [Chitinasiproducens palmae]